MPRFRPDGGAAAPFASWMMGGFEGSSFRFWDGRAIDTVAAFGHDRLAAEDYALARQLGLQTVRDAFRWPLIEARPGRYEWSSVAPMLKAARRADVQVIWDLCHFGIPDHMDLFAADFTERFADYAEAAARLRRSLDERAPWWCPINEISYFAFASGSAAYMAPALPGCADLIKQQLIAAWRAAAERLRDVDPRARLIAIDPLIHVAAPDQPSTVSDEAATGAYEAWDALADEADVIGVNYYPGNQKTTEGRPLGLGDFGYRPLKDLLMEVHARYGRPVLITETGAEQPNTLAWLRYVLAEACDAMEAGAEIAGFCLYPLMDYAGWVDQRHCRCGAIAIGPDDRRAVRPAERDWLRAAQTRKSDRMRTHGGRVLRLDVPA